MSHDPRSIANYILVVRKHFGYDTTQLELQKLLYFCHGTHLVRYKAPLMDGFFEAWEHGPVHPLVWREFNEFKSNPITRRAYSTNLLTGQKRLVTPPEEQKVKTLVAEVVLQLRYLTASQLREKSHARGAPWHSVMESAKINLASGLRIPDDVVAAHFHRHILPVPPVEEDEHVIEDHPPESDGCGKHFSAHNSEQATSTGDD